MLWLTKLLFAVHLGRFHAGPKLQRCAISDINDAGGCVAFIFRFHHHYHLHLVMYMITMFILSGKRVVFLLVIIKLFSLGVTAESLRAKIDRKSAISLQRGHFDPKFQVEGVTPTNHFYTDS